MSADTDWHRGFDAWMAELNELLRPRLGFGAADLSDRPYSDWFDQGIDPEGAAMLITDDPL